MSGEAAPESVQAACSKALARYGLGVDAAGQAIVGARPRTSSNQATPSPAPARKLLAALDLAEAESRKLSPSNQEEDERGPGRRSKSGSARTIRNSSRATSQVRHREPCLALSPRRWKADSRRRRRPATTPTMTPPAAEGDDRPGGPQQQARPQAGRRRSPRGSTAYYTRQFDEEISAEDLCDAEELSRLLRQQLDQQLQHLARRHHPSSPTGCSAG